MFISPLNQNKKLKKVGFFNIYIIFKIKQKNRIIIMYEIKQKPNAIPLLLPFFLFRAHTQYIKTNIHDVLVVFKNFQAIPLPLAARNLVLLQRVCLFFLANRIFRICYVRHVSCILTAVHHFKFENVCIFSKFLCLQLFCSVKNTCQMFYRN